MSDPSPVMRAAATVLDEACAATVAGLSERSRDTLSTVLTHASVRRYEQAPLPDDVVAALAAALVRAPTSSALHSYTHVLVQSAESKRELARLAGGQPWIAAAPLFIVGCADLRRAREVTHAQGYRYSAHDLRMLISATADLTIGLQNASLVAQSLGLGTVFIGGVLNGSLEIARLLGVPERVVPLLGLSIGRPASGLLPAPRPRLPLRLLVHRERWSLRPSSEQRLIDEHDAASCARGDFEGRRIPWQEMGLGEVDPVPVGEYGWREHTARKQGRLSWDAQGAKVDADFAAQGLRVASTGEADEPRR